MRPAAARPAVAVQPRQQSLDCGQTDAISVANGQTTSRQKLRLSSANRLDGVDSGSRPIVWQKSRQVSQEPTPDSGDQTSSSPQQSDLQLRQALSDCGQAARMQIKLLEQQRAVEVNAQLSKLLGKFPVDFGGDACADRKFLCELNLAKLQVVLNDRLSLVEQLNAELIQQLMLKDELQLKKNALLLDIEDLKSFHR